MKTKAIKTLKECIDLSLKAKSNKEHDADMIVEVNNQHWHCYTVALSRREFTLYCDEGTASFVVDSYGDRHSCELVDWEIDEEFRLNKMNKLAKLNKLQTIEDRTRDARRFMMGTKKNPKKINVRKNPVLQIDTDKIAELMIKAGYGKHEIMSGNLDGWSDVLLDILETEYNLETNISAYIRNK